MKLSKVNYKLILNYVGKKYYNQVLITKEIRDIYLETNEKKTRTSLKILSIKFNDDHKYDKFNSDDNTVVTSILSIFGKYYYYPMGIINKNWNRIYKKLYKKNTTSIIQYLSNEILYKNINIVVNKPFNISLVGMYGSYTIINNYLRPSNYLETKNNNSLKIYRFF